MNTSLKFLKFDSAMGHNQYDFIQTWSDRPLGQAGNKPSTLHWGLSKWPHLNGKLKVHYSLTYGSRCLPKGTKESVTFLAGVISACFLTCLNGFGAPQSHGGGQPHTEHWWHQSTSNYTHTPQHHVDDRFHPCFTCLLSQCHIYGCPSAHLTVPYLSELLPEHPRMPV